MPSSWWRRPRRQWPASHHRDTCVGICVGGVPASRLPLFHRFIAVVITSALR